MLTGGTQEHLAYIVDDLDAAISDVAARFGAGPFIVLDDVPLENLRSSEEPAEFAHSTAFGQCGDVPIELMQIHRCSPAAVERGFQLGVTPRLHHVAFAVPDLEAAVAEVEHAGLPSYLRGNLGEIRISFHDAAPLLGHDLELHQDGEEFRGFFAMVREASEGWDGRDPIRRPT